MDNDIDSTTTDPTNTNTVDGTEETEDSNVTLQDLLDPLEDYTDNVQDLITELLDKINQGNEIVENLGELITDFETLIEESTDGTITLSEDDERMQKLLSTIDMINELCGTDFSIEDYCTVQTDDATGEKTYVFSVDELQDADNGLMQLLDHYHLNLETITDDLILEYNRLHDQYKNVIQLQGEISHSIMSLIYKIIDSIPNI